MTYCVFLISCLPPPFFCTNAVALPEPVKLREGGPKEEAKLNDFQEMLVQMAAALNGDHKKDDYPDKLVQDMTVGKAVEYVESAFRTFRDQCWKAIEQGADGDHIVVPLPDGDSRRTSEPCAGKLLSCIFCD